MKIYLAGPDVFDIDAIARGNLLKELCIKHGVEGLFPMDNAPLDAERGSYEQAAWIRKTNMTLLRQCDIVVANMTPFRSPSMDPGTAYEMGVGSAWGKIVVGYTSNEKSYVDKVRDIFICTKGADGQIRDSNGQAVEEFEQHGIALIDNLMMCCGVDAMATSPEEAIILAIRLYESK